MLAAYVGPFSDLLPANEARRRPSLGGFGPPESAGGVELSVPVLSQVTYMTLYTGGFSRFVAFAAAPIATGWSDLAGGIRTR